MRFASKNCLFDCKGSLQWKDKSLDGRFPSKSVKQMFKQTLATSLSMISTSEWVFWDPRSEWRGTTPRESTQVTEIERTLELEELGLRMMRSLNAATDKLCRKRWELSALMDGWMADCQCMAA